MKRILIVLLVVVSLHGVLSAHGNKKLLASDEFYHSYKGIIGRWHTLKNKGELWYLIRRYGVSWKKVVGINGTIKFNRPVFVPYSSKYVKELNKKGRKMSFVSSTGKNFVWPLGKMSKISSLYGMRFGVLHTGIDLPAARGYPIVAVKDGRVTLAKYMDGYGNCIFLEHRKGFVSRYGHASVLLVKKGQFVRKGQVIGFVGSTGNSTGNHLHFEIVYHGIPLNPLHFLPAIRKDKKRKIRRLYNK